MDNENEQLARWLGWKEISLDGFVVFGYQPVDGVFTQAAAPDFRTSNEWAGALLEKLGRYKVELFESFESWGCSILPSKREFVRSYVGQHKSWRDAVVEAALKIIKNESAARSAPAEPST